MPQAATSTLLESLRQAFLSHGRQPEVYVLAFSTLSCPIKELKSSRFSIYGVIGLEKEKSRLPVDVRGSKTSVLQFFTSGLHVTPQARSRIYLFCVLPHRFSRKRETARSLNYRWLSTHVSEMKDKVCVVTNFGIKNVL